MIRALTKGMFLRSLFSQDKPKNVFKMAMRHNLTF